VGFVALDVVDCLLTAPPDFLETQLSLFLLGLDPLAGLLEGDVNAIIFSPSSFLIPVVLSTR